MPAIAFAFAQQIFMTIFHQRRGGGARHHGVFTRNNLFPGRFIHHDWLHPSLGGGFHQLHLTAFGGEVAITPFRQRQQHHAEIAAARREVVFVARRGAAVAHLLQQSVIDQFLQAARQNIGRDVAAFLELVKAGKAREGIAQDHDINFMLTGAMATDYSEASCYFLMDSETRSWSSQACETFGLRVDQLPELKLSSDIIGQVTQRAADLTGLPAGIPVVAGTSDMAASLLGSGVYEPGMASDSTGTSTLMTVVSPRPLHHPLVNNLHLANAAWGGFTILDAGGDAVRWARLALADNQITHPQLLQEAAAVPAGAEGLLFLPYLTGERLAEHTNSRAQFFGLQRKHRRGHLFRAVLEGVAFASWRNLRQLQKCGQYPQQMIASGGGARSSLWLEIKAAAYNLPILSTRNQENGVTGCGIIAGVGAGLYADFASGVRQTVQFDKVISPDPRLRDYYHACSELFDTLYRQSAALYDRLDALSVGRD